MTRERWRPRIGTVLLAANLVLLALPLTGVWLLRLYESALIRQTESELIAQAAVLAASYKAAWLADGGAGVTAMPATNAAQEGRPWPPWSATLDLAEDPVLPPPAEAQPAPPAEPAAARAAARLRPVLADAQRVTLAAIRILDAFGVVVASTGGDQAFSLAQQEEVAAALRGAAVSTLRRRSRRVEHYSFDSISRGSDLRVFVALPALEGDRILGAVLLSRTPRSIEQALYGKRWHLLGLAGILALGGIAFAWAAARTITGPIYGLMLQARRAAAGEPGALVPLARKGTREVADLSDSLIRMARGLEARADYIRGFAAEVSHEFKTPLAALRGTVELLREHVAAMSEEERRRFLDNLAGDVDRLDRLVRRLLELARADVMPRPAAARPVSLDEVVPPVLERYAAEGLAIRALPPPEPVRADADAETVETVLANLLDNVRQHAGPRASAAVAWRIDDGKAVLEVADDGPGISAGNSGRIFDRFFTTARDRGGTGLGLPIVRSRLAAVGGSIEHRPGGLGARFIVRLPPG